MPISCNLASRYLKVVASLKTVPPRSSFSVNFFKEYLTSSLVKILIPVNVFNKSSDFFSCSSSSLPKNPLVFIVLYASFNFFFVFLETGKLSTFAVNSFCLIFSSIGRFLSMTALTNNRLSSGFIYKSAVFINSSLSSIVRYRG